MDLGSVQYHHTMGPGVNVNAPVSQHKLHQAVREGVAVVSPFRAEAVHQPIHSEEAEQGLSRLPVKLRPSEVESLSLSAVPL